jgi:hypothetical protein
MFLKGLGAAPGIHLPETVSVALMAHAGPWLGQGDSGSLRASAFTSNKGILQSLERKGAERMDSEPG